MLENKLLSLLPYGSTPVSIVCDYAKDNLNDTIDNNHVVIAEAVNGFGINLLLISRSLASDIGERLVCGTQK